MVPPPQGVDDAIDGDSVFWEIMLTGEDSLSSLRQHAIALRLPRHRLRAWRHPRAYGDEGERGLVEQFTGGGTLPPVQQPRHRRQTLIFLLSTRGTIL